MTQYLFFNDEWLPDDQPVISAGNRGFRYGDGLFETMCVVNGVIRLADYHFDRLFAGLQLLQFQLPPHFNAAWLSANIAATCQKNGHPIARVRLTIFRGDGSLTEPGKAPGCIIQSEPLPAASPETSNQQLVTGIYPLARKSADAFSPLKCNNYLASVMAARYAREQGWGDAFLLNAAGRICETAIANVFILIGNSLYTPPLNEGCVAGVMRRFVLENAAMAGYDAQETVLTVDELHAADEVFLTNALGFRPVHCFLSTEYATRRTAALLDQLRSKWVSTSHG
jgi:branched-chain amino acid aminotransferase